MDNRHHSIHIFPDLNDLYAAVTERWRELAVDAVNDHGEFHVALSGGTTPRYLYEQLATPALAKVLPWHTTHIYFGDERCVPPDHKDSNFHMASEALLRHVPIPQQQIYRIEADIPEPAVGASRYEQQLGASLPRDNRNGKYFDLIMLGLGPDGHIASLFPDSDILTEHNKLVSAVHVDKIQAWRISLTFIAIGLARHVIILVAGENKSDIIAKVLGNRPHSEAFPVEMIPSSTNPEWYLDAAAANQLDDTC